MLFGYPPLSITRAKQSQRVASAATIVGFIAVSTAITTAVSAVVMHPGYSPAFFAISSLSAALP